MSDVEYSYDAWGNCTIVSDYNGYGARNPFRYRGYYFDTDLNMYYLMTRYYDPKIGRFINADSIEYLKPDKINGLNLYAYCKNNPMMLVDYSGTDAILITAYGYNGLPIVGHTALAIQDESGVWYIVEFSGTMISNAAVSVTQVTNADIYAEIESRYRAYTENDINSAAGLNKFKRIISSIFHSDVPYQTLYMSGDYSASLEAAETDVSTNSQLYDPITNNCAQYINRILKAEDNDTGSMKSYFDTSYALVPAFFHNRTKQAYEFASAVQGVLDFFGSLFVNN